MASPVLEYRIKSKDESKSGVDSAKANASGLNDKMKDLSKGMEGVNKLASTMMGAGALAGVTMALRKVYQGAAECEAAFAKLHPEMQNVIGSATSWKKSTDELKAATGALLSSGVSPLRAFLQENLIDTLTQVANGLAGVTDGIDGMGGAITRVISMKGVQDQIKSITSSVMSGTVQNLIYNLEEVKANLDEKIGHMAKAYEGKDMTPVDSMLYQSLLEALQNVTVQIAYTKKLQPSDGWYQYTTRPEKEADYSQPGYEIGTDTSWIEKAMAVLGKTSEPVVNELTNLEELWGPACEYLEIIARKSEQPYDFTNAQENAGWARDLNLEAFTGFISGMIGSLTGLITSIDTVRIIMDPLGVILQAFVAYLEPTINSLLTPLIGVLSIIGQLLGAVVLPVLDALGPVVSFLVELFVSAYNFLLPVFNMFITAIVGIANGLNIALLRPIRTVGATLMWLMAVISDFAYNLTNPITEKDRNTAGDLGAIVAAIWTEAAADVNKYLLKPIDTGDVTTAGTTYTGATTGSTTSGTATYRATTINVVVNVENAYTTIRELALLVRDEIAAAEAINN